MKRRVARYDQLITETEIPEDPIELDDLEKIMAVLELDPEREYISAGEDNIMVGIEYIAASIQDYAGDYIRWLDQPPPSSETIRYQLECLARGIEHHLRCDESDQTSLLLAVDAMAPEARDALHRKLKVLPCDIVPKLVKGTLSWTMVLEATHSALAERRGGDSKDLSFGGMVILLVELYEAATGKPATWSGKPNGAYGIDGGIQRIGQTTCARFVHMFFQAVDPEMPLTRIDNEIRALLRFRNNAKQRA